MDFVPKFFEEIRQLRVKRFWPLSVGKPFKIIKLVWFTIFDLRGIDMNEKMQSNPMSGRSLVLPMDITIAKEVTRKNIGSVFFFDFFMDGLIHGFSKVESPTSTIPTSMFITTICATFGKKKISFPIVTKENDSNSGIINTFFHNAFYSQIY